MKSKNISALELMYLKASLCKLGLNAERLSENVVRIKSLNGNFILKKTNKDAMLASGNKKISLYENNLYPLIERSEGEYPTKSLFVITK